MQPDRRVGHILWGTVIMMALISVVVVMRNGKPEWL
jgi:hypothetical protein